MGTGPGQGQSSCHPSSDLKPTLPSGVRGAAGIDGVLPPASPMQSLSHGQDMGLEDAESLFEEDVVAFLATVSSGSIAEALSDVPARSPFLEKLSFEQCLGRLQAGLKAVREGTLTAAEEVDVFTPLWWLADYRLAVYMEAFARVVALSSTMLLETFKAFASSLLHRKSFRAVVRLYAVAPLLGASGDRHWHREVARHENGAGSFQACRGCLAIEQ